MTGQPPIKVLIIDDHDLFRTGLRALLEDEGFEVADASSGAAGVRRAPSFGPDVVVMDMNMPEMTGIEATPLVLRAVPQASVLVLTIATDDARVVDAIRAGASGYLLKDAPLEDIVAAIQAAAAGHSSISPRVAGAVLETVRARETVEDPVLPRSVADLSSREREVLSLIARGCDNTEIAQRLYLSQSTVKSHVSRLLDKIGVGNRVQAATFAVRHGLELPE